MRGLGCGTEQIGIDAQDLGDGFDPRAGHRLPLSDRGRADLQLGGNPLDGIATLEEFVEDGIAHADVLSAARRQLQQQTKNMALSDACHTCGMVDRDPPMRPRNPKAIEIGARIKHAREIRNLSQPQLARIAGISSGAIGQYEVGISMPRPEKIERLAHILEVSTEWLLTGNEPDEMIRAQTKSEQEALRLMRMIPMAEHATALAIWETLSRQKAKDTKK